MNNSQPLKEMEENIQREITNTKRKNSNPVSRNTFMCVPSMKDILNMAQV
jgi:hypothetical protein